MDHTLSSDHQEVARIIGETIAKRYHINKDWFKIHLVDKPEDTVLITSGTRVEIICGYNVMHPKFVEILERSIKFGVVRCHQNYSLVTSDTVLEWKDTRGKFASVRGKVDDILKMMLPKYYLKYTVKRTLEIEGEDISTGFKHRVVSTNSNDTEEELVLRLRLEMGKMSGYWGPDEDVHEGAE